MLSGIDWCQVIIGDGEGGKKKNQQSNLRICLAD